MVGQQLPQTNEKCYSVLQCPMWPFLPLFYGSKHSRTCVSRGGTFKFIHVSFYVGDPGLL